MARSIVHGIVLYAALLAFAWAGASGQAARKERIRLVSADSLVSISQGDENITMLIGNVNLVQGQARIVCRTALFNDKSQYAELRNSVSIFDGKRTLTADTVFYNGSTRIEEAAGNVVLRTGTRVLRTPYLTYNQETMVATVYEQVQIDDFIEGVTLWGVTGYYDRKNDYARMWDGVELLKTDSAGTDSILVKALLMEAWGGRQQVMLYDSVTIDRNRMHAVCTSALYSAEPPMLHLKGSPVVSIENQVLKGDTVSLHLNELSFQGGMICGNARITVTDSLTGADDFMQGDTIYITAVNDTIQEVDIRSQAVSTYHVSEEEDEPGINTVSGDRIQLFFNDRQKLDRVRIASSPGVCTGKYAPKQDRGAPGLTRKIAGQLKRKKPETQ